MDEKENFSPEQIQRFKDDDVFYKRFVKSIEKDTGGNFSMVRPIDDKVQCFPASNTVTNHICYLDGK